MRENGNLIDTEIVVIGAGPAGLYSVFACGMVGFCGCHVIEALDKSGGQCTALYPDKPINNIPGILPILAKDLVSNLEKQVEQFRPNFHFNEKSVGISKADDNKWRIKTDKGNEFIAKVIIVSTGAGAFSAVKVPLDEAHLFEDKSLFYNVQDKELFEGKRIVIIGGGDPAVDWSVALCETSKVHIVHRRNQFRAYPENIHRMETRAQDGKITMHTPFQLDKIHGKDGMVSGVTIKSQTGEERYIEADIILAFLGMASEAGDIINCGIEVEKNKIFIDPQTGKTSLDGIYAVGDCVMYPNKYTIILSGFSEALQAAHNVRVYLQPNRPFYQQSFNTMYGCGCGS